MTAGLAWVGYLLITTIDDPAQFMPDNVGWLIVATVLIAISLAMNIWLFSLFLHIEPGCYYSLELVAWLSVAGQLLRYLPGRFWGVAYQISATTREQIPAMRLVRANVDLMVFSLCGSLIVALVLLAERQGWPWWTLMLASISGIALLCGIFLGGANWLLQKFAQCMPEKIKQVLNKLAEGRLTVSRLAFILLVFIGSWIVYLAGWKLLGQVFYAFKEVDFISLCAFYTIASILGIVSALTPAGLGVREAAFVMLAAGGSTANESVAFFAIFGRVWLTLIEIVLFVIVFLLYSPKGEKKMSPLPTHDIEGLHILDPKDNRGLKSSYITILQDKALRRHIPTGTGKLAVDLGCGFGRLTPLLVECGWQAIGIDPSPELLVYANQNYPGPEYRIGGLPDLPLEPATISLLLIQNVLRSLKMMNRLDLISGFGRYLAQDSCVLLVENLRTNHPDYLPEAVIIEMVEREGLRLVKRVPLRAARWWMIYLIRYGLIPRSLHGQIAEWELKRMSERRGLPRWQYWNVLFLFEKVG